MSLRLSTLAALVATLVATCAVPVLSGSHYSSYYNETFPWNVAKTATVPPLTVSSPAAGQLSISNTFTSTPFNSVYNVNVTVDAVANLAFPFTGNSGTYQDVDTGIDVVAGGKVTFFIPPGYTGGNWCFELGRAGAGNQVRTIGLFHPHIPHPIPSPAFRPVLPIAYSGTATRPHCQSVSLTLLVLVPLIVAMMCVVLLGSAGRLVHRL